MASGITSVAHCEDRRARYRLDKEIEERMRRAVRTWEVLSSRQGRSNRCKKMKGKK